MKNHHISLKIKEELKTEGIIEIFEKESPIIQAISNLRNLVNILLIFGIIYIFIIIFIQKYFYMISIYVSLLFSFFMINTVYKQTDKTLYFYSKKLGGKKAKSYFRKDDGILQTITYNIKLMKKEEYKLINKILKINHLNNINCIKELKNYFGKNNIQENFEVKKFLGNFLGVFLIPITAILISIYTSISNNINLEQNILNISYIILGAVFVFIIIIPISLAYSIKKLSLTNIYTLPRLEKLLVEILLNKEISYQKHKTYNYYYKKYYKIKK